MKYIVGVDEAGRGPLAGPVAVCAAAVAADFDFATHFQGLGDSKVLTEKRREILFEEVRILAESGVVRFSVRFGDAEVIDSRGITHAVSSALHSCFAELSMPVSETKVYLDGLLKAPAAYAQETVIHGDALIPVISLASVIAKVSRDAHMRTLATTHPSYGFEEHKGYGTKKHIEAIRLHGLSPVHRKSFLSRILAA